MLCIVLTTQKHGFLCCYGKEEDGTFWSLFERGELFGEYQKCCYTRGVVAGSVIDAITIHRLLDAKVVPVGRVDEVLILLTGARKNGSHIVGIGDIHVIFELDVTLCL